MVELGIFTKNDKIELLNGRIIEKMSRNPPHDSALHRLMYLLFRVLPEPYTFRSQAALRLSASVPEPDIAIVQGPPSRYEARHPDASDTLLVIEVSESTLPDDQGEKLAIYAHAAIPHYWILNLIDRRLEVYTDPTGPDHFPPYRSRSDIPEGGQVTIPVAAPPPNQKLTIQVRDILPGSAR